MSGRLAAERKNRYWKMLCVAALALMKNVPFIGFAPWACALVDAICLALVMVWFDREPFSVPVLLGALISVVSWLQGGILGLWVPFRMAGYVLAALLWRKGSAGKAIRALLGAALLFTCSVLGMAIGYVAIKHMGAWEALRNVVRNSWFAGVWNILACECFAGIVCVWERCGRERTML